MLSGWDLVAGLGMPPGSFTSSTQGQTSASASQLIDHQQNVTVSQPMEQTVPVSQQIAQNVSASQPINQTNASAS